MKPFLAFNYPWQSLPDSLYPRIIREYLDGGVETFVFTDPLIHACLENPERIEFLHTLEKTMNVRFVAMHAPYGPKNDMDIPKTEDRTAMFDTHRRAIEIAAEFGCKTYTIHVGSYDYVENHIPVPTLRDLAQQTLEKILPTAEKNGVVIAVENSFEPPNTAAEVLAVISPFLSSPAVGVCYDTGHAHIRAPYPWKKRENYPAYHLKRNWWEGFEEEADALETLRDHIVTCHIHDNTGYADLHAMPFDGSIDWDALMPKLFNCPRMLEYQTEQCFNEGTNWAGKLLAPTGGYSIRAQIEAFRKLGFR